MGPGLLLDKIRRHFPWLALIWADGGYNAWQVDAAVAKVPRLHLEIVKRSDDIKGFVVLPRRWVVERTFSWFGRNRRLAKDFENLAVTLATFVTLASIQLALRRLARVYAPSSATPVGMMAPVLLPRGKRLLSDRSADLRHATRQRRVCVDSGRSRDRGASDR